MKKQLFKASLLFLCVHSLNAQKIDKTQFSLSLEWNAATSKFDTTELNQESFKYNSDSIFFEIKTKEWDYKGKNIFDQKSNFELYSSNGVRINS
jgi:hypothetical protein